MKKVVLPILFSLLTITCLSAQGLTQTLKGQVLDQQSKAPLIGATVMIAGTQPLKGTVTDINGYYILPNVALGRQVVKAGYIGYKEQTIPNILLTSGKETVLNIELAESLTKMQEVVVEVFTEKNALDREYAPLSSRTFNVEETRRFAGSRNDPSRMAANYAGVVSNNDARNDIVIRGNSPAGLLWRLEGVDIPNPNHFGTMGSTGGPVSMINNSVLGRSTFLTGAFPAMYGNATSGAFDLQFRNGNADKREYTGQIGFGGFELGAEGPFKKGAASYLVNYRYSVPAVFKAMGLSFCTGSAIPYYQDASFKIDVPTQKIGRFTIFGLGGISSINLKGDLKDSTNLYADPYRNIYQSTKSGVIGVSNTYFWSNKTYTKFTLAATGIATKTKQDSLDIERTANAQFRDNSWERKLTAHFTLNKKINAQNTVVAGFIANQTTAHYSDSATYISGKFRSFRDFEASTHFVQGYGNFQHRFSEAFLLNLGLYSQFLALNNTVSLEPRLNIKYQIDPANTFSMAVGRHSQMQPLSLYFNRKQTGENWYEVPNKNLGFTYSNQIVIGYDHYFSGVLHFKSEAYFQGIQNVPVEKQASSFSMLNAGAGFSLTDKPDLENKGTGRNYGLELTLERTFKNGYYFLNTLSMFDSKYRGSDGILRNTAFNGNYVLNVLAGKELNLNEKNVLALDCRISLAGGHRYTPLDLEASQLQHKEVFREDRAFSEQVKNYFRTDFKITYRRNTPRIMQEWFLDLQNIFNTQNVYSLQYDVSRNQVRTVNQLGFYPNFNYRIQF